MRVALLAHGPTDAVRAARFPVDEPVEAGGIDDAAALAPELPRCDDSATAPSQRCRRTADALGLHAAVDDALAGCDHGRWTGRTLDEVAAAEPEALARWLADPEAVPHDGESLAAFVARVGTWLDALRDHPRGILAVVDPGVVRAALVHGLGAPITTTWRVDVAPLTLAVLVGEPNRWNLRELRPARRRP
jgi:broad specificity phosphatase PhoE